MPHTAGLYLETAVIWPNLHTSHHRGPKYDTNGWSEALLGNKTQGVRAQAWVLDNRAMEA